MIEDGIVNELVQVGGAATAQNSEPQSIEDPRLDLNDPKSWNKITGGERGKSGVRVTPNIALGQPAILRALSILSFGVAKIPFDVFRVNPDGTKERDRKHQANQFLRRKINPLISAFTFKQTATFHLKFRGNFVGVITRDNAARPLQIIPCDPDRWGISVNGGEVKYLIGSGKDARFLGPADVFHLKGLSYDGLMGLDLFTLMKEAIGLGVAAREFGSRFFGKGANAGGVLMTPAGLSEKAVDRLHKDFKKATTGLDNAFSVALLEEGCKWTQTTIAPEQAQFLETRKLEIREVGNIIGIPSHMIGDKEGQAYNSLEMESQAFLDHSLDPILCSWEDEANDKLLTEQEKRDGTVFIEANRLAAKRIDTKTESETLISEANNGLLLMDEARSIRNRPPYPDKIGQRFRMPANIIYADASKAADQAAQQQQQTAAARAEVVNLVSDCLERMQKIEVAQLQAAAKRDGNFTQWAENWYADHRKRIESALSPALRVAATLFDAAPPVAADVAAAWCESSWREVWNLTECLPAQLPGKLDQLISGWQNRSKETAAKILGV